MNRRTARARSFAALPLPPQRVLVVASALFLGLAAVVLVVGEVPGDASLRAAILAAASPAVVEAMRVVNLAGEGRVVIPALLGVVLVTPWARRHWWVWLSLVATVPATEAVVKAMVARPRPEDVSLGFPSGHAMAAGAFFGALAWLATRGGPPRARWGTWTLALVAVIGVGLARVMLRAHWPSDAAAGALLGLALATATLLAAEVRERTLRWRAPRRAPAPRSPRESPGETAWR